MEQYFFKYSFYSAILFMSNIYEIIHYVTEIVFPYRYHYFKTVT